jgi:hypothetical protein
VTETGRQFPSLTFMTSRSTLVSLLLFATLGAGAPVAAAEPPPGDGYQYRGVVAAGDWVRLRTLNGSITVETSRGSELEVIAQVRARRSDPAAVEIVRREGAGGVTFCALWPAQRRTCAADGDYRHGGLERNDLQVDFLVRVPARARVDLHTVNGTISLRGDAAAVIARTTNGPIELDLHRQIGAGGVRLETTNGPIRVRAERPVDADVEARAVNGRIQIGPHSYRRSARATVGAGGRPLVARTVNGAVHIDAR